MGNGEGQTVMTRVFLLEKLSSAKVGTYNSLLPNKTPPLFLKPYILGFLLNSEPLLKQNSLSIVESSHTKSYPITPPKVHYAIPLIC